MLRPLSMPRILIVDDNPEILFVVEAALTASGFDVVATAFPEDALARLASEPFDAAVLDVMMPRMSGYQLLSRLRQLPGGDRLPVLFLSALTDADARIQGLRLGADDYLGKPFAADELVLRMERLVRNSRPAPLPALQGNLSNFSLASLVQTLLEEGQSGELEVRGPDFVAGLDFRDGRLLAARAGRLHGKEAALALIEAREGQFRFVAGTPENTADARPLEWQSLLLEAAWTADELDRRRGLLPAPEKILTVLTSQPPEPPAELGGVPILEAFEVLSTGRANTASGAESHCLASRRRVQLALAWLIEQGLVRAAP